MEAEAPATAKVKKLKLLRRKEI